MHALDMIQKREHYISIGEKKSFNIPAEIYFYAVFENGACRKGLKKLEEIDRYFYVIGRKKCLHLQNPSGLGCRMDLT